MGGSIGDLRANLASSAILLASKILERRIFVCMLLETSEASRALYYMNVRFSLFCIHNIIYNRLEKNHTKNFDLFYTQASSSL